MTDLDAAFRDTHLANIYTHGRSVEYHAETGVVTSIKAFVDQVFLPVPGGFDSEATEKTTVITMQASDVPRITRGEKIIDGTVSYEVVAVVADDSDEFETAVAVK